MAPAALKSALREIIREYSVAAISVSTDIFDVVVGDAAPGREATAETWFQQASLSKPVATAFVLEFFSRQGLSVDTPVADLLDSFPGPPHFKLEAAAGAPEGCVARLTLRMLMDHSGLDMAYVPALDSSGPMPTPQELLNGFGESYPALRVTKEPGVSFGYSGGAFLLLQYLIEQITSSDVESATSEWLDAVGLRSYSFAQRPTAHAECAHGYRDDGSEYNPEVGRFWFPPFAAGGIGTPRAMMDFLSRLARAYHDPEAKWPLSHETACTMLTPRPSVVVQQGCRDFMGCEVGTGTFLAACGPNSVALHQAANEGFRGIYAVVFDGPDRGRGAVILSNGDTNALLANARVLQELLLLDDWGQWTGVSTQYLREHKEFDIAGLSPVQIVIGGYRDLVFRSFAPARERSQRAQSA